MKLDLSASIAKLKGPFIRQSTDLAQNVYKTQKKLQIRE